MRILVLLALRTYQRVLSPLKPPCCRFLPSCSCYAVEAVETHGVCCGLVLALRRLGRCHPWGGSGYDPVPPRRRPHGHQPLDVRSG